MRFCEWFSEIICLGVDRQLNSDKCLHPSLAWCLQDVGTHHSPLLSPPPQGWWAHPHPSVLSDPGRGELPLQPAPEPCADPPGRREGGTGRAGADHRPIGGGAEVEDMSDRSLSELAKTRQLSVGPHLIFLGCFRGNMNSSRTSRASEALPREASGSRKLPSAIPTRPIC